MKKNKTTRNLVRRKAARVPRPLPNAYSAASKQITPPVAFGAVAGTKSSLPITLGVGKMMLVSNYELVANFTNASGPAFSIAGFVCNPGLPSFPWLSTIAQNYQRFRWKQLRFIFVPSVATTNDGSAWLYLQYDFQDLAPTTLAEVMTSESACSGNVWYGGPISPEVAFRPNLTISDNIFVNYDKARATQPWYYVRSSQAGVSISSGGALGGIIPLGLTFTQGTVPDTSARPCTLYYGTDGVAAGVTVAGRLFAAYECELSDPISPNLDV